MTQKQESEQTMKNYQIAMDKFREVSREHSKVTADYRALKLGDAEFIASRNKLTAASIEVDKAEAAL